MCERNKLVKVAQADGRLRQENNMIGAFLLIVFADEIALHAVNDLEIRLAVLECLGCVRECLDYAMIRHGNSRPTPAVCCLYELFDRHDGIHRTHRRMGM